MVRRCRSWLRRLNFRGFYVVGIEKDGELITAGTLRLQSYRLLGPGSRIAGKECATF
jgi:hypothetical protein